MAATASASNQTKTHNPHTRTQSNKQVGHKQTFLEEFDFRASQLSRDLRDGVRLARLVDALEVRACLCRCRWAFLFLCLTHQSHSL